jgi:hypothetical protein
MALLKILSANARHRDQLEAAYRDLTSDPRVRVQQRHLVATHGNETDVLYMAVTYEIEDEKTPEEEAQLLATRMEEERQRDQQKIAEERRHLAELCERAREIDGDPYWSGFANATQRKAYLLSTYALGKADAEMVMELLKPEMLVVRNFRLTTPGGD